MIDITCPIIRETEYSFSVETESFYFDIYKAWNGAGGGAMFRAGCYVKKAGARRYHIDYALFAEWDHRDKKDAFDHAKAWLLDYMRRLGAELTEAAQTGEERKCRIFGCTQNNACPGGCYWVASDLCSACVQEGG